MKPTFVSTEFGELINANNITSIRIEAIESTKTFVVIMSHTEGYPVNISHHTSREDADSAMHRFVEQLGNIVYIG